jgi:23S rRNA (adenine2503-C2)-methyltransferase
MPVVNLLDLPLSDLETLAESLGAEAYRGRQVAGWIYQKGVTEIAAMSDLSMEFRRRLGERGEIRWPALERLTPSQDGSRKLVLKLADDARVQSVLMPDDDRLTLCVSRSGAASVALSASPGPWVSNGT